MSPPMNTDGLVAVYALGQWHPVESKTFERGTVNRDVGFWLDATSGHVIAMPLVEIKAWRFKSEACV